MRFIRRRDDAPAAVDAGPDAPDVPDVSDLPDDVPPRPPGDQPGAVFAGVLDGRHLWVAVPERPGHLALRDPDAGVVLGAEAPPSDAQAGWLDARLDLAAAFAGGAERLEVVLVPPGTAAPRPVWAPPLDDLPGHGPVPEADDGPAYALERGPGDGLVVRRRDRAAGPRLWALADVGPYGARLVLAETPPGADVLALVRDHTTLATWPLAPDEPGRSAAALDARDLDAAAWARAGRASLVVGGGVPVRRRRNDLDAGAAVALPELASGPDEPAGPGGRLRLRWTADGRLVARVIPGESDSGSGGDEGGA